MKYISYILSVLLFLFIYSCSSNNINTDKQEVLTPIVTYAEVDKVETTVGDVINFQLVINYYPGITLKIPDLMKHFSDFTIVEEKKDPLRKVDNRFEDSFNIKLQVKETGSFIIQPVIVQYAVPNEMINKLGKSGISKTSKIYIEVKSILKPEDKNKDIEDIKPSEEIKVISKYVIFVFVLILLVILIGVYFLIKFLKRPEKELLPHEIALKDLNILEKLNLHGKGEFKEFYFLLSEIFRKYLNNRFDFHAMEKTSNEIFVNLEKNSEIDSANKEFIKQFIETTDLYKYTDFISNEKTAIEILQQTGKFVEITKRIPDKEEKKGKNND